MWPFAGLTLALGWRRLNVRLTRCLLVALSGTAVSVAAFLCVAPDSTVHVPYFFPRFLVHQALPALLLVALAARGMERTFARVGYLGEAAVTRDSTGSSRSGTASSG